MASVVETVHLAARVPSDLATRLSKIAEKNERSSSAELRIALKAHVEGYDEEGNRLPLPIKTATGS